MLPRAKEDGFTLLETLIGFLILSIALGVFAQTIFTSTKQIKSVDDRQSLWSAMQEASVLNMAVEDTSSSQGIIIEQSSSNCELSLVGIPGATRMIKLNKITARFDDQAGPQFETTQIEGFGE